MRIAATDGLEGLTFGRLARASDLPKSTLQVLFKTRENLQAQTLSAGAEAFAAEIGARVATATGSERLTALCTAWFDLVAAKGRAGGCLVTAAVTEYRARPGTIQSLIASHRGRWRAALQAAAEIAQREGGLRADVEVEQLVFEILAFQSTANASAGHPEAVDLMRARRSVEALLARSCPSPASIGTE